MSEKSISINRGLSLAHQRDEVIYICQCIEDGNWYAVNTNSLDRDFLECEVQAECYPDGTVYDYAEQPRH